MKKILTALFILCIIGIIFFTRPTPEWQPLAVTQTYDSTVVLLPLDSRPPCTDFVVELGKIANIRILLPPDELLDCYRQPGDREKLREWLKLNSGSADAVIVSTDMLIHGGLWTSRDSIGDDEDVQATLRILEKIHADHPQIPIYAFNILPRLWLSDTDENKAYQEEILQYSSLKDQVYTFGDQRDTERLHELERDIPPAILNQYHALYEENIELNKTLIQMAQSGIFAQLIIGQDDGQEFGIPNIAKRQLLHYLEQQNVPADRVTVTKGTDEVALTLLGVINSQMREFKPNVFVQYNDAAAPSRIMPYMPNSVQTTVQEKIRLLRGTIVQNPDEADFILFVAIGTKENKAQRFYLNQEIQALLKKQYRVALVDLSEHFAADETVFPMLLNNGAPINQLIAYAGWNTTSNAVGTAVVQAALFTSGLHATGNAEETLSLYAHNLSFLSERYLEDYFYLKQVIDTVNDELHAQKADAYDLNGAYPAAQALMEAEMNRKAYMLERSKAYNLPLQIETEHGTMNVKISDLQMNARFPWDRTFEIDLDSRTTLAIFKKTKF